MKFRRHIRAARALLLTGAFGLGACDVHDRLLDVQTPDIVDPGNTQSIAARNLLHRSRGRLLALHRR
jgi:hypothetical protein